MTYRAPVDELRFALRTHGHLDEVLALPEAAVDSDTVDAILEEAGKFAEGDWAESNRPGDVNGARLVDGKVQSDPSFKKAFDAYCEAGWISLRAPEAYGGQGLPSVLAAACEELWMAGNLALSLMPMLTNGAIAAIEAHASEELKAFWLPKMCDGTWSGTMNLTEPQAGTDLAQVTTRAVPKGDGKYAITGQKIFITWGDHELTENVVHLVLARLPDAPAGVKGISLFIVPKYLVGADGSIGARNPAHAVSLEHKLGIHGSPTCVMQFEEAEGYLVGEAGKGLANMFTMMNHARLGVGIEGYAVAERAFQAALAYAKERVQSRDIGSASPEAVTIIHHPDVRRMLLTQKALLAAQRALCLQAAARLDLAERHPHEASRAQAQAELDFMIPIVKGWCTENGTVLTNMAMQVYGGMGYIEETGAAQYVRDVRITAIYEGANGVQALDLIGRKTATDGGKVAKAILSEAQSLADKIRAQENGMAEALSAAIAQAQASVDFVVQSFATKQPQNAAAGSLPYLMQMGITLGAAEMVRAYLAAGEALQDTANAPFSEAFYHTRQETARIYFTQVLPQAAAYAAQLLHGAEALLAMPVAHFDL